MSQRAQGRRAGSPDTRGEILEAARRVFAENGYNGATIRGIAAEAGVDPALIHHYFGTKERLFGASIDLPVPPADVVRSILNRGRDDLGRGLAETFFMIWEQEEARASFLSILRSAVAGEDQAVTAFRQFITASLLSEIAPAIGGDDAVLRAQLMASQLVGVAMTRYVVQLEPIASSSVEEIVDLVAPRIQSYVSG